jgi:hypothetical protein
MPYYASRTATAATRMARNFGFWFDAGLQASAIVNMGGGDRQWH